MDYLQTRLEALEQRTHIVERQLRWWRGLAGALIVLAVLTWALPMGAAQEEAPAADSRSLAQRLGALEQKLRYLTSATNEEGRPEVVITGANLRIVNGLGSTDCTDAEGNPIPDCPNGVGNLIVGYNELRLDLGPDIRIGSHNVVVGEQQNFSHVGGLVVGRFNTISGDFASVSGGQFNDASGRAATVSGGSSNTASGRAASVSGGAGNTASGEAASVSGGAGNTASGLVATVSGGQNNTASGRAATVSGGGTNPHLWREAGQHRQRQCLFGQRRK